MTEGLFSERSLFWRTLLETGDCGLVVLCRNRGTLVPSVLTKAFDEAVSLGNDEKASKLAELIRLALNEINSDESLVEFEEFSELKKELLACQGDRPWVREKVFKKFSERLEDYRLGVWLEHLTLLYMRIANTNFLDTTALLIREGLRIWTQTNDDGLAQERLERVWRWPVSGCLQARGSVSKKAGLKEVLREATDREVPVPRLDTALMLLLESIDDYRSSTDFPLLNSDGRGDLEEVARVLLIARGRNLSFRARRQSFSVPSHVLQDRDPKSGQAAMELPILATLAGASAAAYEAVASAARAVVTQDLAARDFVAKVWDWCCKNKSSPRAVGG